MPLSHAAAARQPQRALDAATGHGGGYPAVTRFRKSAFYLRGASEAMLYA